MGVKASGVGLIGQSYYVVLKFHSIILCNCLSRRFLSKVIKAFLKVK